MCNILAVKSQGAGPPTNSYLSNKTMEDEPEEVTFNVDRLHHSQLRSDPFAAIHPNLTIASDFCVDPAKVVTVSTLATLNPRSPSDDEAELASCNHLEGPFNYADWDSSNETVVTQHRTDHEANGCV